MSYYVYVIWSEKIRKRYIGCASDFKKRLGEHNKGKQRFTRGGIPWELIYVESFECLKDARKRESYLKSRSGRRYLDSKIPK
ncbi:MAG: GIY-YIG nuclease family protein [Candidatus Tritonobacter lacicola]|nr:GIY-YIG nuclease family protein [Candidatus Tritonobacter lacicola]